MNKPENNNLILLTGARGFVGLRLLDSLRKNGFTVASMPSDMARSADEGEIFKYVNTLSPKYIVSTAAISDIGTCERDPEASYKANYILPVILAKASYAVRAKLVHFSSDQVYTGLSLVGPYREDMELPEPANTYARHKLMAERAVLGITADAVLLRATWMYDMPIEGAKNRGNFLVNTIEALTRGEKMAFSSREFRGITYVRLLADIFDKVLELPGGVYNFGSESTSSMLDTARALVSMLGYAKESSDIVLDKLALDPSFNKHDLWIDTSRIRSYGISIPTTLEGLEICVNEYKRRGTLL